MNMRRSIQGACCFSVLLLALCSGCATAPKHAYDGDPLPLDQVATIKGTSTDWSWSAGSTTFTILRVDDRRLCHFFSSPPSVAYVQPGPHILVIQGANGNVTFTLFFDLIANAGETYLVRGETRGIVVHYKFWIEQQSTSNTVAGPIYYTPSLFRNCFSTNMPPAFRDEPSSQGQLSDDQ